MKPRGVKDPLTGLTWMVISPVVDRTSKV